MLKRKNTINGKPEAILDSPVLPQQPGTSMKEYSYTTYTLAKSLKKKLKNYISNRRKNKISFPNSILLKTLKSEVPLHKDRPCCLLKHLKYHIWNALLKLAYHFSSVMTWTLLHYLGLSLTIYFQRMTNRQTERKQLFGTLMLNMKQ